MSITGERKVELIGEFARQSDDTGSPEDSEREQAWRRQRRRTTLVFRITSRVSIVAAA